MSFQPIISPMYRMYPLGDAAVVVVFGDSIAHLTLSRVRAFSGKLARAPFKGFVEQVPALTTVTVYYQPREVRTATAVSPYQAVVQLVEQILAKGEEAPEAVAVKVHHIPVCYGGVCGPDLEFVAQTNGLTPQDVIDLHSAGEYLVYMIGFAPGFPYLGGMDSRIASPRKPTPRSTIPAGSVGIAGEQTGVYPLETPGGWQLIGRTPLALFTPHASTPSLLKAGDMVRFYPISIEEFIHWKKEEHEP